MSLNALPVSVSDLTTLQSGIQFFTNTAEATSEMGAINAPGSTDSVFIYATKLLSTNISLSQVAMAVSALMEGGTIAVGDTTTPNTLTLLSTQFLPDQVTNALANGFNPTVYAAESLGSALSTNASFNTNFVGLSVSQFAAAVSTATGVNVNAIQQFVTNWQAFFTANPSALQGRTVTQASYGAAFGDAAGVALLNPTSANLQTQVSTNPAFPFSPNTIQGLVANALILNAEGKYETGKALGALAPHDLLQGEAGAAPGTLTLTVNVDSGPAFTTNFAKATFNAPPGTNVLGPSNTLNAGDNFGSTVGDATLNFQAVASLLGNPPLATGITMTGVATANILNSSGGVAGFSGSVTGLTTATMQAGSTGAVILGTPNGVGLNTALTTVNVNANQNFIGWIATAALAGAADKVTVNVTGTHGTAAASKQIVLGNDSGTPGTAATPQNAYEDETISATAASFIQLSNGASGALSTTTFTLTGAGAMQLSANAKGDFAKVTAIDASANTGGVAITGALNIGATIVGGVNNAVPAGLLNGNTVLASFKGGSGNDFLDISSENKAQVAAFTTLDGDGGRDTLILNSVVVNGITTALNQTNFEVIGVNAGLAGTVDISKLGALVDTLQLFGPAAGDVTLDNVPTGFTLAAGANSGVGLNYTVNGPTGTNDVFNLTATIHAGNDFNNLIFNHFETVNFTITDTTNGILNINNLKMVPDVGGGSTLNIVENQVGVVGTFPTITIAGKTDVTTSGLINISGTDQGGINFVGTVTAGKIDASGYAGPVHMAANLNTTTGGATSAITILGSPQDDILVGSIAKDSINSGAGNDIVANQVNAVSAITANDQITLGAGNDQVNLFGATAGAGGTLLNTAQGAIPLVTDFIPGTDILHLSATPPLPTTVCFSLTPELTSAATRSRISCRMGAPLQ